MRDLMERLGLSATFFKGGLAEIGRHLAQGHRLAVMGIPTRWRGGPGDMVSVAA